MGRIRRCGSVLAFVLAVLFLSLPAFSQGSNNGRILGTITDQTGGVIAGAMVSITDTARGTTRTLTADSAGAYNAPELIPGTYTVRAQFQGFTTTERQNITVEVGGEVRVDLMLQPGQTTQTVTVTEALPLVETTTATLGGTISNQLIGDLPVQGRNFQKLLELRPGVYLAPGSGKWSQSSDGMRREHNVYILDGMDTVEGFSSQSVVNASPIFGDATSIIPIEAIQEFNTEQAPKAEYGWKPGAIVNVGLRSGTNALHGTAYAYGRDSALDARNPFIVLPNPRQTVGIEDFGGTVGGPIKKDKLFFLFGYEGQRNTIGAPSSSLSLPTRAAIGNTATSVLDACNALTVAQVPRDLSLAMSGLTYNAAAPIGSRCAVDPSNPGVFQNGNSINLSIQPIGNANLDNGLTKIDYHLSDKHTISGEYFIGNYQGLGPQNNAAAQSYWDTNTFARSMVTGLHWTWLPTSSIVNELRGGFNRENQQSFPGDCNNIGQPSYSYLANMGTNSTPMAGVGLPANCGFPVLNITGGGVTFSGTGCCGTFPKIQGPDKTIQVMDNLSYIHGRHYFKFGEENRRMDYQGGTYGSARGSFTFNNSGALTALQEFLLGQISSSPNSAVELLGNPARDIHTWAVAAFAQDDWRITDRLTLNLGLRYEMVTPLTEAHGQLAEFNPSLNPPFAQQGMQVHNLWPIANDFSPRVGLAWDIRGDSKWVVRASGNIMYVLEGFNVFVSQQGAGVPIGLNGIPTGATLNGVTGPGTITTGTVSFSASQVAWAINPSTVIAGQSTVLPTGAISCTTATPCPITTIAPNFHRPYAPEWNLSIQHPFTNDLSLQVAYVGTHGTGLVGLDDINAAPLGSGWLTGAPCAPYASPAALIAAKVSSTCEQQNRPLFSKFPYLSNIVQISNQDFSNYNGLQVTLTQRPWHGLSYLLGYTWSHSLDEAGGDWNGATLPTNQFNIRSDYGNSQDDLRNRMTLSLTYALPERKGFARMLEGWKVNSVVNVQSALPWFVSDTTDDIGGTGDKTDKWDFLGNSKNFDGLGFQAPCTGPSAACTSATQKVPYFFAGSTNPAAPTSDAGCNAAATAADSNFNPTNPGYTFSASMARYGCYDIKGSILYPAAFGTYGNMQRGLFRGKGLKLWDMSLTKDTKFTERFSGQFRFEVFNILNLTEYTPSVSGNPAAGNNFGSAGATPDVQISNPEVGSGAARSIQFGFKLAF